MIERYTLPRMAEIWSSDSRYRHWLEIELLVIEARAELGELDQETAARLREAARVDLDRFREIAATTHHDVYAFLQVLDEQLGDDARHFHHGLTSADLVDSALALQLRASCDVLIEDLQKLASAIKEKAFQYRDTPMIGRTHGGHAEPITFGLKLAQWYVEVSRHLARMTRLREVIGFGMVSGSVGTYAQSNPRIEEAVCRKLGLKAPAVTTQILQRDRHAEFVNGLALIGSSIARFATEIRHLARTELREVAEPIGPDQRASATMPHKRNPVLCERVCGLARVLRGYAVTAMENIDLWHERDLSHSSAERIVLPDATALLDFLVQTMTTVISGLQVFPARMRQNLAMTDEVIYSGWVLQALVDAGMYRRDAYALVQEHAWRSLDEGVPFADALAQDDRVREYLDKERLVACFSLEQALQHVDYMFKRVFSPTGES